MGRRYNGPVRLSLTSALIAPGKTSGQPWDGAGSLPPEVADALRSGSKPSGLQGKLFHALVGGTAMFAMAKLLPWAADAMNTAFTAPDPEITMSLNGVVLVTAPMRQDNYNPTWSDTEVLTQSLEIHGSDQLELHAIDKDLGSRFGLHTDDEIGVCTHQGMPWVDEQGYAAGDDFRCNGQLWAVAVRITPDLAAFASRPHTRGSM